MGLFIDNGDERVEAEGMRLVSVTVVWKERFMLKQKTDKDLKKERNKQRDWRQGWQALFTFRTSPANIHVAGVEQTHFDVHTEQRVLKK